MRKMKRTMAAVLSLTLACTLLIAPAEGQSAKKKMKLNKTKATLYVGKKLTLKVKNTKKKVKWSSSKKAVASVTKKGVVKAKKKRKNESSTPPMLPGKIMFKASCVHAMPTSATPVATFSDPCDI